MSHKSLIAFSIIAVLLTGCGTLPKTPELLIENAKDGGMFSDKDTFDVNQPVAQVAAVLKEKSSACLKRRIEVSYWQNGLRHVHATVLTPRVVAGNGRARLTMQTKDVSPNVIVINADEMPPDGWYGMVVDAYQVGNRTRVESYFQGGFKGAFTAIKPWVTGTNGGCPDLTQ